SSRSVVGDPGALPVRPYDTLKQPAFGANVDCAADLGDDVARAPFPRDYRLGGVLNSNSFSVELARRRAGMGTGCIQHDCQDGQAGSGRVAHHRSFLQSVVWVERSETHHPSPVTD